MSDSFRVKAKLFISIEVTFLLLALFTDKKRGKSQQGGLAPSSFQTTGGVHELVARAVRGKYVRQRLMVQVDSLALTAISTIPRVRTQRTKKPSRFVHALSARPLKVQGGREFSPCADGMKYIFFALYVGYTWTLCVGRWLAAAVET